MSQNVTIAGADYTSVPSIQVPKTGGGTAEFVDTSDATLNSGGKLLDTVTAYANGTKYTGTIKTRDASSMSVSGATVTATSGYYASNTSKSVASGSATTPATTITANPSISVNSSTGVITATTSTTQSVTPTVSAGYVSSGTAGTITVSGSDTESLTTLGATTYNTSSSDQTISAGKFLTGAQTIRGVTTSNLSAANIKSGVTIEVGDSADSDRILSVTGTYSGSSTIATATKAVGSSDATSLSFTVSGQPKAFALHATSSINLSSSTRYIASIQTDGTNVYTNDVYRNGSTYATNYDATSSSFSYSSGTLTVTSSKFFRRNVTYRLIYVY